MIRPQALTLDDYIVNIKIDFIQKLQYNNNIILNMVLT